MFEGPPPVSAPASALIGEAPAETAEVVDQEHINIELIVDAGANENRSRHNSMPAVTSGRALNEFDGERDGEMIRVQPIA